MCGLGERGHSDPVGAAAPCRRSQLRLGAARPSPASAGALQLWRDVPHTARRHTRTYAQTHTCKHTSTHAGSPGINIFICQKNNLGKKKKATYGSRPSAGTRLKHRWLPVFFLHLLLLCSDYQATPITCCRHFYSLFIFQTPPQATPPPKPKDDREKKINTRSSIFQTDFITNVAPQKKKKFLFKFLFISYFQASPWRSFPQACVYV